MKWNDILRGISESTDPGFELWRVVDEERPMDLVLPTLLSNFDSDGRALEGRSEKQLAWQRNGWVTQRTRVVWASAARWQSRMSP
jgi:hypothetical protein